MGNTVNPAGKRVFDDVYTFPQDSQDLADDIHLFANTRSGTSADRAALLPGLIRPGMLFSESDTGKILVALAGGGWRLVDQDTGDVGLSLASGWSGHVSEPAPSHRVRGGFVSFDGRLAATSGAGAVLSTLPVGSRPGVQIVTLAYDAGANIWHSLVIGVNGSLNLFTKSAAVTDLRLAAIAPSPVA